MSEEKSPAQWAIDYIENRPILAHNPMIPLFNRIAGFLFGFGAIAVENRIHSRALMTAAHRHFIAGAICALSVELLSRMPTNPQDSDAKVIEFIKLHPELFPEPPRVKYRDILHEWKPIR